MKSKIGLILGLFLLNGFMSTLAEATPVDFHITGSLTGTIYGEGDQRQGEELILNVPICGEIDVDLAYDFTLDDGGSFYVSIDQDISSFEFSNINADFHHPYTP